MRMNARVVALGAGVFFISLAICVQGLLPFRRHPNARTAQHHDPRQSWHDLVQQLEVFDVQVLVLESQPRDVASWSGQARH